LPRPDTDASVQGLAFMSHCAEGAGTLQECTIQG